MMNDALKTLLPTFGWSEGQTHDIELTGGTDPVVPTAFKVTDTATATLAAVGLAANDLWQLRTGRRQKIAIDARKATASLRSGKYLVMDETPVDSGRNPVVGIYPSKGGRWNYLHGNFPHHRAATLKVLGVEENPEAVRNAVAKWDGLELEEAIIAAGSAGGMVRTMKEWAEHPQAKAIATLPLIEIIKIGEAPPEPLPKGSRPLSGIRVLDLTRVIAGPTCGRTLAEHGADVLKISSKHLPSIGRQEHDTGHGKLSAYLDLREETDRETLRGLVREADVFSQGYRPGTLAEKGFSPEALAKLRPGIVCVSLCAFSHVGPWSSRRGFDTVIQSVSGIVARQGELFPGEKPGPQFYPVSAIDFLTGYLMAAGAMVALRRRATEGGSWLVRTSLAQVGRWLVNQGEIPEAQRKNIPKEFTPEELKQWSITSNTPLGKLQHLGPTLQLSETPPRWDRPTVMPGHHQPVWPPRSA